MITWWISRPTSSLLRRLLRWCLVLAFLMIPALAVRHWLKCADTAGRTFPTGTGRVSRKPHRASAQICADALAAFPGYEPHSQLLEGMVQMRQGRLQQALDRFWNARHHDATRQLAFSLSGEAFYQLGNHREAIRILSVAVQADPENVEAHRWAAAACYDIGAMDYAPAPPAKGGRTGSGRSAAQSAARPDSQGFRTLRSGGRRVPRSLAASSRSESLGRGPRGTGGMLAPGRPVRRGSRRARAVRGKARSRRPASRMPTGAGTASAGNPVRPPRVGQGPAAPGCLAGPRRDCFGGRRCDAGRRDFGTSRRCASARRSGPIPAGPGLPAFGPRRPGRRAGRNHARTARAGQAVHQASRTGLQRFERSPATIRDRRHGQPAGAAAVGARLVRSRADARSGTPAVARGIAWNWRGNKSGTKRQEPAAAAERPHESCPHGTSRR